MSFSNSAFRAFHVNLFFFVLSRAKYAQDHLLKNFIRHLVLEGGDVTALEQRLAIKFLSLDDQKRNGKIIGALAFFLSALPFASCKRRALELELRTVVKFNGVNNGLKVCGFRFLPP